MIPGAVETFQRCVEHDIRVGSSTGYTRELMEVVVPVANAAGYKPEVVLCSEDAQDGRCDMVEIRMHESTECLSIQSSCESG